MSSIKLFKNRHARSQRDAGREAWYFSIVDVVAILSDSAAPSACWRKSKQRLETEGNETVTNGHGLKITVADGKLRLADVTDTAQLLRLIPPIPSPKAESFKQRLARAGYEPIEATEDPQLAIDRALETRLKNGANDCTQRRTHQAGACAVRGQIAIWPGRVGRPPPSCASRCRLASADFLDLEG